MKKLFALTMIWLVTSAFTPARPKIRYKLTNQTNQRIVAVTQLESADRSFTIADSMTVIADGDNDYIGYATNRYQFKPYFKVLIQTESGQYSTPILMHKDRCTAYEITIKADTVSVQESNFYRIRREVVDWYVVFLITFLIRGSTLLLFASRYARSFLLPFVVLNTGLVILFQVISTQAVVAAEWRFLLYALIPLLEFISYYRLSNDNRSAARLLSGIVFGGALWVFPGYLLILFGKFLFAGC